MKIARIVEETEAEKGDLTWEKESLVHEDPISRETKTLRRLTLGNLKTRESNRHLSKKLNPATNVADITYVLTNWLPTSVMDMEKWAIELLTIQNKKGTFRRTTRGLSSELNLKHSPVTAHLAV